MILLEDVTVEAREVTLHFADPHGNLTIHLDEGLTANDVAEGLEFSAEVLRKMTGKIVN